MRPGIDPKVDYAFKRLFASSGNVALLRHLLEAVLGLRRPLVGVEILNPFNDKETSDDKLSIVDVKARDDTGLQFNVEMQMLAPRHFTGRILYYWARFHPQQLTEGMDYRQLRSTISLCFVNTVLFPDLPGYHRHFQLWEDSHRHVLSDHLSIHLIELPRFDRGAEQLATPQDVWLYFLRHAATLDSERLPAALDVPPIHKALEVLNVLTQSELERERYEARLRVLLDQTTLENAERDAVEALRLKVEELRLKDEELHQNREVLRQNQEALRSAEDGRRQAVADQVHLCQRMLRLPLSPAGELAALSLERLRELARELEERLFPPGA